MTLFILAYVAGVLTIASPCIFPVLPFALARAEVPFRRGALPMLLGLAIAFAATASLASVAGGWAVEISNHGRTAALALLTLFGLMMLVPSLAAWLMMPLASVGSRLAGRVEQRTGAGRATACGSLLLGMATGLVWAPCAGPVLGLILAGAALGGPGATTSLLLLIYALGAVTSLAAGLLLGGRLLLAVKRSMRWGVGLRRVLGALVVAGAAAIWLGLDTGVLTRWSSVGTNRIEQGLITALPASPAVAMGTPTHAASDSGLSGPLVSLLAAHRWLNTAPLRPEDLRGKVVLVNFWTYSCINCLRALPYVRAWAAKYQDRGLMVVGVHTPEFAFEKDAANVQTALASLGVHYPIAIDNDFAIWRAFGNYAWPALYFFGADGRLRHAALGEGGYARSERLIRELLTEANRGPLTGGSATIIGEGPQTPADEGDLYSRETYIGYAQGRNFASPGGVKDDTANLYRAAPALRLNHWSFAGVWVVGSEFATLDGTSGRIAYRFHARDLHLVLAPPTPGHAVRFRVRIDGVAPGASHGADVDAAGWGEVRDGRLYQLVRQAGQVADRTFEIEFFGSGVRAYVFTFG